MQNKLSSIDANTRPKSVHCSKKQNPSDNPNPKE